MTGPAVLKQNRRNNVIAGCCICVNNIVATGAQVTVHTIALPTV